MPFLFDDVTAALTALGAASYDKLQLLDASVLLAERFPHLDPNGPALVLNCHLSDLPVLRDRLLQVYPPAHPVQMLEGAVSPSTLETLAEHEAKTVYLPPLPRPGSYAALQDIVARLRAPDGCPWDRALNWEKLRPSLLEEAYELLAGLDELDFRKISEEQGDLLLQVAMQAQIATEEGRFRFPEVIAHIVEKLVRRHPHVFGEVEVSGTDEVLANWEAIKAAERAKNGEKKSPLGGVPAGLPALAQAEAYLDRMSRLRTTPPPAQPWAQLAALGPEETISSDEFGQALFELVAWALARGIESESALRAANRRFAEQVAREQVE